MSSEPAEDSTPGVHAAVFQEMALDALQELDDPLEAARAVAALIEKQLAEGDPLAHDLLTAAIRWAMVGIEHLSGRLPRR